MRIPAASGRSVGAGMRLRETYFSMRAKHGAWFEVAGNEYRE